MLSERKTIDDLLYQTAAEQTDALHLSELLPAVKVVPQAQAAQRLQQVPKGKPAISKRRWVVYGVAAAVALLLCVPLFFERVTVNGERYFSLGGNVYIDGMPYAIQKENRGQLLLLAEDSNQYALIDAVAHTEQSIMVYPVGTVQPPYENARMPAAESEDVQSCKARWMFPIVGDLVVRTGAGMAHEELALLHAGQLVSMVGTQGKWAIIEWDNGVAYVFARYLYPAEEVPAVQGEAVKYAAEELNIRALPTSRDESEIVGVLAVGEKVVCTGEIGSWTQIRCQGANAYVFTKYLEAKPRLDAVAPR